MMTEDCELYVIGQGYKHVSQIAPGDRVYSLNGLKVEEIPVLAARSEFINEKIHSINSGQHNIDCTKNTLHLYHSDNHGLKYLLTQDISSHTRSKSADPNKYTPVLSWPYYQGYRNCTDLELEYIARMLVVREYDVPSILSITKRCTGEDAQVLVDMLEFWCSQAPGRGQFNRVSVGSRSHPIHDRLVLDELSRIVLLAGYTVSIINLNERSWMLKVFYEPMPVPSSIPKTEKFLQKLYAGVVYSIKVEGKRPVMGRSKARCVYLPVY